jgi:hypothetical protein
MLSCKQASELVSQSLDRSLTMRERMSVRLHLLICAACARFGRQLAFIQAMIKKFISDTEQNEALKLSPNAKDRMTKEIESKVVKSGGK